MTQTTFAPTVDELVARHQKFLEQVSARQVKDASCFMDIWHEVLCLWKEFLRLGEVPRRYEIRERLNLLVQVPYIDLTSDEVEAARMKQFA